MANRIGRQGHDTSIETAGVVSALKGMLRRAGLAPNRPVARLSGRDLITTADLGFTQRGVPAALLPIPGGPMAELLTSPERPPVDPEPSV
jgi:hypothetical protein